MDTNYTYPHLFDIDETLDTDLFQGLNSQDSPNNDTMYNKKLTNREEDMYHSFASANNNSYLHYLQNNHNTNSQDFFYGPIYQQQQQNQHMLMSNIPTMGLNLDIPDYDYLQQEQPHPSNQRVQYNWLYDPSNAFLPTTHTNMYCNETMINNVMPSKSTHNQQRYDCTMSENENVMVEGGLSRGYVSLSVGNECKRS